MKKNSFRKRAFCLVAVMLSLFAVCSNNLHAADIAYDPGVVDGLPQVQTVAAGSTIALTDMGFKKTNFVLIGWNTIKVPIYVTSMAMEAMVTNMGEFYAVGSSHIITGDKALYAVWAIDKNNDGYPDYCGSVIRPTLSKALYERMMSALEEEMSVEDDVSLRRGTVPWNNYYDLTASYDSVYYVGCTYNIDYDNRLWEDLIQLNTNYSFNEKTAIPLIPMNLIIKYGGVLKENSMIGGQAYKALDTIKITQAMVSDGFTVDSLFDIYPFVFNSIEKDGLGILKMYFVDPANNDAHPAITGFNPAAAQAWGKPFIDTEKSGYTDTLTIKFNIYNKPAFESPVIRQRVDTAGRIDLKHVSGTPLKYMMRCINDFRWRPADSPLTNAEREEIGNGVSICLREMDRTIGYQMVQKAYYFTPSFNPTDHSREFSDFFDECLYAYNDEVLASYTTLEYDAVDIVYSSLFGTSIPVPRPASGTPAGNSYDVQLSMALAFAGVGTPPYVGMDALDVADSTAIANWYTVLGQRNADKIIVPDQCRETFCLAFETNIPPAIQREIGIKTIAGVTSTPGTGKYYVNSREDFPFTLTFSGGQPLKVIATRVHSQLSEELQGTDLGGGMFSYVIRQVQEAWNVTVLSEPATDNETITGARVWTSANTLYIQSDKAVRANIYTLSGRLFKQVDVPEGTTSEQLERGVYIVEIDGSRHKVVVK